MQERLHVRGLNILAALCLCATVAHADTARSKILVSLDVEDDAAPDWVCVITDTRVCNPGGESLGKVSNPDRCLTSELSAFRKIVRAQADPDRTSQFVESAKFEGLYGAGIIGAAAALTRRATSNDCSSLDHRGCEPVVDLAAFPTGAITCGGRTRGGASQRVAILGLTFNTVQKIGVEHVEFSGGNVATLTFRGDFPSSTVTFVQLLGGHYATSSMKFVGSRESVVVTLHPRCSVITAELPPHVEPLDKVDIAGAGLFECKSSNDRVTPTMPIAIPYAPTGETKSLRVAHSPDREGDEDNPVFEASWTTALPPAPLKLGARAFAFTWSPPHDDCIADAWEEPVGENNKYWTGRCPRATLDNGALCTVRENMKVHTASPQKLSGHTRSTSCAYTCQIDPKLLPVALPMHLRFDRVRTLEGPPRADVLAYGWRDEIGYSGQETTSQVAPADRHVMIEFLPDVMDDWKEHHGDRIDAIRVTNRGVSDQLDLSGRGDAGPPAWTTLSTPNRICTDRIRLSVFGTRVYDEKTLLIERGKLVLSNPFKYRSTAHMYLFAGAGLLYDEFPYLGTPTVEAGFGWQLDGEFVREYLLGGKGPQLGWLSLDLELSGQLGKMLYRRVEDPPDRAGFANEIAQLETVPYARFDARAAIELWWTPRWSTGVATSVALGTAVNFDDDTRVGRLRLSLSYELQPVIFTLIARRLWAMLVLGVRRHEQHFDYTTDFLGEPTPFLRRDNQWFWTLRLRGRIG